ncbi:glycosyltransferase family 39 protein [Patescibacteria group bacterium]|nr:glycosyltransferase family 39 protein [Patescibacteria group bacterium]
MKFFLTFPKPTFLKPTFPKPKLWHTIALTATIVAFFVLRLINLNGLPVFVDEAIYIRWAQVMRSEPTLRFLPLQDGKQPLFMWAMIPMFKIFNDPVIAGRVLSVLAGFGTLLGLTTLSFLLFSSLKISLLTALLYAITPYTVFFDRLALVDSMLAMFGIWSLVVGFLYVKKPRLDLAMILGVILGLAFLTKSPAIFFYLWQPILAIFFLKKTQFGTGFKLLAGWLLAFVISQAIYNILRLGPNFNMVGSRNQDYLFSFSEVLQHPLNPLTGNLKSTLSWIFALLTPPIALSAFLSFSKKETRKKALAILTISITPLIAQALIAKVYTPRYLYFAVLPLIILTSLGLVWISKKVKKQTLLILLVLLFPLITSVFYIFKPAEINMPSRMRHGYLEEWTAGWGQKDFANYLINLSNQGKTIVVGAEGYFGTLPDGLQIYTEGRPNITVIGIGQPAVKIPEALENTSKENLIFLVINKSRNNLKPHDLQRLELIKSYPKPARPDGTQEELQVYQLIK